MQCIGHSLVVFGLRSAAALPAHEPARGAEYTKLARAALAGAACYDQRLFISPVAEDRLLCTLCTNVIRDTTVVAANGDATGKDDPCSCHFGGSCLARAMAVRKECPNDRRAIASTIPYTKIDREVASLKVKCHVAPDACAATGELGRGDRLWWRAHEAVCGFVNVACPHCAARVLRRDLERHVQDDCLVHRMVVHTCDGILPVLYAAPKSYSLPFRTAMLTFVGLANPPMPIDATGCFAAIVKLMRNHKSTRSVQEVACHIVTVMCRDAANRTLAGAAGAVEAVVTALETHGADLNVAGHACSALRSLAWSHPDNRERAGVAGACEAVLKASTTHDANNMLAILSCDVLSNLTCSHPANKERAGAAGAFTELLKLCNTHVADPGVHEQAIAAIMSLTNDHPANQQRAADAGVIELVVAAMARFPTDADIQGYSCSFLDTLTLLPAHLPRVAAAGARAALAAALLAHPEQVHVKTWGALALGRLPQQ